jgi:UDP-N-acetylglucosamine 2-epimerase (non-hydrolysing)
MKVALICGARPNFMKVAPLCHEFEKRDIEYVLVNTGQHFDKNMSQDFFDEFEINPTHHLSPSRESVIKQFADIALGLEEIFLSEKPDLVMVVGDVNSTLIGAIVANKIGIKLAHVEAGLRSFNRLMPEEHNRLLTDRISDLLLVTMEEGIEHLANEGIKDNAHLVGNLMIDTLAKFADQVPDTQEEFYFSTLHRAENIDNQEVFNEILDALEIIAKDAPIYLPLHPRTEKMAEKFGLMDRLNTIFKILPPLKYKDAVYYQKNAKLVLTDSGGVQEETSYLGTPCITLRTETERPITVTLGTNVIGGIKKDTILEAYKNINFSRHEITIPYWDGKTAGRICETILQYGD